MKEIKKRDFAKELRDEITNILEQSNGIKEQDELFWIDNYPEETSMLVDSVGKDEKDWFFKEDNEIWYLSDIKDIGALQEIYDGITAFIDIK